MKKFLTCAMSALLTGNPGRIADYASSGER